MENSNLIIRIPEPCHEDWNKMVPDDKGKFCGSCSKSVFDFSNKTDTEIRDILIEYKDQKVCGHFKKTQIDRPLNIRINLSDLPKNVSATKAFAIAIFLVFGTLLFSCTNEKNQEVGKVEVVEEHMMGAMPYVVPMLKGDTILENDSLVKNVCESDFIEGDMKIEEVYLGGAVAIVTDTVIEEPPMKGEVQMVEDTVKGKTKYVNVEPKDTIIAPALDTTFTTAIKNIEHLPINKQAAFSIYPNPGNGEFTIKYDILKRADVKVDIFDLHGSLIRTVVNVSGQYEGKYQVAVNLTELPNGIYIVSLINNGKRSTGKLVIER